MVRYSPNGRWLVSASDDESVRFYDLTKEYQPGKNYETAFGASAASLDVASPATAPHP
jgi:WD40 repeat protein